MIFLTKELKTYITTREMPYGLLCY